MKSQQTDEHLIEQLLALEREGADKAFERLMIRHGPLVMGVCRQVLKHEQDAEDAFQASFLTLARRAAAIQNRQVLGSWLREVAYRHALRLSSESTRRRQPKPGLDREESSPEEAESNATRNEIRQILRAEVDCLPEKYRALVVHCYLEGKSNEEAARCLRFPVGTVKGRLWRARGLLRERLKRRCGADANQLVQAWA
jgi:RNA polymerase sigma factor (sigma-70 family)